MGYLLVVPTLSAALMSERYRAFNRFNRICWRQNICSLIHTLVACTLLSIALTTDAALTADRLYPHYNLLLHVDVAISLGYFSLSLPLSVYLAFWLRAGYPYASSTLCAHHLMVVTAQVTFLLTQYPAFYVAASGVLFEASNAFYLPQVLMILTALTVLLYMLR